MSRQLLRAARSCSRCPREAAAEGRQRCRARPTPTARLPRSEACGQSTGRPPQPSAPRLTAARSRQARAPPPPRGAPHLAGRPAQVRQQPPQEVQQQRHGRTPAGTLLAPALGGGRANQQPGAGREAPSANREKAVRRAEPIGGRGRAVRAGGVGMEARLNAAAQGAAMSGAARQAPGGADFGGPSDFGCMRPAGGVPQRAGGGKRLSLNSGH